MSKKIRWRCSSVGTDESGTGGLFGSSSFVGVKITRSLLNEIEKLPWFKRVEKIKDSKKFSEEECIQLSSEIEKTLKENKDFVVWNLTLVKHNNMWKQYKDSNKIKCICHNWIHKKLVGESTFHVIDNFLKNYTKQYSVAPKEAVIIPIDKFFIKGEYKALSISLASIIARGRYLRNLKKLANYLKINLDDTLNHNCAPTKIEPILDKLEKQGYKREFIFSNFCKEDIWESKYKPQLLDYLSYKK